MAFYRAYSRLIWITFLAVSMAFVESSVVIYLRELYYPAGFAFPMVPMPGKIAITEFLREIATLIMLLAMGFLGGKNALQRFAWFIYSFAVWDLFYYVFLKLVLNWPLSWFTWDVLFLIPVVWTGPVVAPVIVSLTMIMLAFTLLFFDRRSEQLIINKPVFFLVILGSVLIFLSFIWDFTGFLHRQYSLAAMLDLKTASQALNLYTPVSYNWFLLLAGEAAVFSGIMIIIFKNRKRPSDVVSRNRKS
jgi:hypothetical protein